jgi:pyruvate-ferredoxin/flavodoxin oxidoreductase
MAEPDASEDRTGDAPASEARSEPQASGVPASEARSEPEASGVPASEARSEPQASGVPASEARSEPEASEVSEGSSRLAGWLRRFWGRSPAEPGPYPGSEALLPSDQALEALEGLICEGLVRTPGTPACAGVARRLDPPGPPARNAFGRPLREEIGTGTRGSVAVATGMALSGLRATAFLAGDELVSGQDDLCAAAQRLVPLVLHVSNTQGGHAGYHRVAGSGLFQALASSGQEALDLSLLARWLAERALVPGLVASDAGCIERLKLPDEELVRAYLGHPDEPIASPTEGQRILFGNQRARLLRWFDPARPVATGEIRGEAEAARARLGNRVFFWDHVRELAIQGMQELARLTGRPLSFLSRYRLADAQLVLVAQGAAVQAARAAADALRRSRGWKVGVVGVSWLRPFPAPELVEALVQDRAVAVIEVLDDPLAAEAPLLREIEAALGAGPRLLSATCAAPGPDPAQLAALCELLREPKRPRRVRLDRVAVSQTSGFPRRDALLESVANAYPELREPGLPRSEPAEPGAEGGRSAGLVGLESELPPDAPRLLAEALAAEVGPRVRGRVTHPQPGALDARLRAASDDFPDPGPGAPVSLLLVATPRPRELGDPLASVAPGGTLLLASGEAPEQIWAAMPPAWRAAVRERELRVLAVGEALEAGIEALRACLRGEEAALLEQGSAREVGWRDLPAADPGEPELPRVVRRIERVRPTHDSLPRFWGELVQPRQAGASAELADPLASSGAVPAGASALQPRAGAAGLPVLDPDACSGCGRCWIACPDSALGVSVLGTEALLTGASHLAGTRGPAADALRRAHKHLAGRLGGQLAKAEAGSLELEACREGWNWLAEQLRLSEEDRPAHEEAFEATAELVARLRPVVTGPFFHEPEQQKKGDGELLILAVDPRSCVGCGLCVKSCPDDALRLADPTRERVEALEQEWRLWEGLPDTAGATLARAAEHPEVGRLASVLLSRHCAQAQVGGAAGEPGSGERLAGRLVAALLEHHSQRQLAELVGTLEEQRSSLEQRVREQLAEGLSATDMDTLSEALSGVAGGRVELSALGQRLDALGAQTRFDRRAALRMARLAGALERSRQRLAEGEDGLGRARFGVVVARGGLAEWAARYPHHPYYAPLTLAPTAQGVELARGIAAGLVAEHLALVRSLRSAALEIEPPPDRSARLEAIERLTWEDLEPEDRAACPPLLLLGDDATLLGQGFELVTRLLVSDLPVKIVLLDGRGQLDGPEAGAEPAMVAMAHRRAFVLAASLAHPEHLARGLLDALAWPGPALVQLHAPSPARHGFAVDAALERARLAVEGRAHLLFRYDPSAEGRFGLRASLEGNPGLEEDWGEVNFAQWAAAESRFAEHFEPLEQDAALSLAEWLALAESERRGKTPAIEVGEQTLAVGVRVARAAAERLAIWSSLKELTGVVSPFTDRIRAALEQEIEAEQRKALEELQAEHEAAIAGLRSGTDQEMLTRLTDRLMALASLGSSRPQGQEGNGA